MQSSSHIFIHLLVPYVMAQEVASQRLRANANSVSPIPLQKVLPNYKKRCPIPLYEYHCPRCTRKFEEIVAVNAPNPVCPDCKSSNVTKLISASNFELKGNGWYKDGYGLKKP